MKYNLNLILFASFFLALAIKISYTDYTIKTKRDVLQIAVALLATGFFWSIDQFLVKTQDLLNASADWYDIFIILLLIIVYTGIGAGSVQVYQYIAKKGIEKTYEQVDKIVRKETTVTKEETRETTITPEKTPDK